MADAAPAGAAPAPASTPTAVPPGAAGVGKVTPGGPKPGAKRASIADLGSAGDDFGGSSAEAAEPALPKAETAEPEPELDAAADGETTPEPEAEPEIEVEEPQEQPDPEQEPLFGMPPQDLIAALRKGELPEALAASIYRTLNINGQQVQVELPELERGYMRRADHTRRLQELAPLRKEAEGILAADQQRIARWRQDPKALRAELEQMGAFDAFYAAAQGLAAEVAAWRQMTPEQRAAAESQKQAERQLAELQRREQEIAERERNATVSAKTQEYGRQIQELMPAAFAQHQIVPSKLSMEIFQSQIVAIGTQLSERGEFQGITPQIADEAARATLEVLQDLQRHGTPAPAAQAAPPAPQAQPRRVMTPALPATPLPAGPPRGSVQRTVANQRRASIADFSNMTSGRRG